MKPAICTGFDYNIPFALQVPMIRDAGFEVVSIGARPEHSGYPTAQGRGRIKELTLDKGLEIDSVHAPFPEGDRLCSLDEKQRVESVRQCQIGIDAAQDLDAGTIVIHLNAGPDSTIEGQMMGQGIKSVRALSEHALEKGIRIAVENSWGQPYANMLDGILTQFSDEPIGFCYDSGHGNVDQAGFRDLIKYGHRLMCLHLHDNLGEDTHMLPWEGNIDWPGFMSTLRGLEYSGSLLLEVGMENSQFGAPAVFLSEAMKRAARLLQL